MLAHIVSHGNSKKRAWHSPSYLLWCKSDYTTGLQYSPGECHWLVCQGVHTPVDVVCIHLWMCGRAQQHTALLLSMLQYVGLACMSFRLHGLTIRSCNCYKEDLFLVHWCTQERWRMSQMGPVHYTAVSVIATLSSSTFPPQRWPRRHTAVSRKANNTAATTL
jgi:hypothetical protein